MTTQVPNHARFRANNWFNLYKMNPEMAISNTHLRELRFSSTMDCGEPFDNFCNLAREEGVFILAVAPNRRVLQVFHQADFVGGTYAMSKKIPVALIGFDCQATPVEIEIDTSVRDIVEQVPSWEMLVDPLVQEEDEFKNLTESEAFEMRNLIGIPNILAKSFLDAPSKDPVSLGFLFRTAMLDFNEAIDTDDSQESFRESGEHILQFCWLAARGKIPPLVYSVSQDSAVLRWSRDKHELNLQSASSHLSLNAEMSTRDDQLMLTFESMREFFEDNKKDQREDRAYKETKKPGFKRLGAQIKQLILFASATKPYNEPSTKPTDFAALFLEEANIGKAATTLQQELNGRNINFVVSQSLVTALFLGHFTWSCPDFPSNLSIFYC